VSSGEATESSRPDFDIFERLLFPDLTDATSDLSTSDSPFEVEFLGLSVFEPGIFDRSDLNDREDSFVSDLLKEGREERVGPLLSTEVDETVALGVEVPEPPFDGWLPIFDPAYLRAR